MEATTPTNPPQGPDRVEQMEALLRMVRADPKAATDQDFGAAVDQVLSLPAAERVSIARDDALNAATHLIEMLQRLKNVAPDQVRLVSFFVTSTAARLRRACGLDAGDGAG